MLGGPATIIAQTRPSRELRRVEIGHDPVAGKHDDDTLMMLPMMNDRSAPGRSISGQKAGSDLEDISNIAGTCPDGTHDEGACQGFRPRPQDHDWRTIYRGKAYPPIVSGTGGRAD